MTLTTRWIAMVIVAAAGLLASCGDGGSQPTVIATPAVRADGPVAAAPAGASPQAKADAVARLGMALAEQQSGNSSRAISLAYESLTKWPDYPEAQRFLLEAIPQATAAARQAVVQATADARATSASRPQPTATVPPRPTGVPTSMPAIAPPVLGPAPSALAQFYGLVTSHRFADAYQLLSADVRRDYPADRFEAAYRDLIAADPLVLREQSSDAAGASVWACVRMTRQPGAQHMAGDVRLVREGGTFKIGSSALKAQADCGGALPISPLPTSAGAQVSNAAGLQATQRPGAAPPPAPTAKPVTAPNTTASSQALSSNATSCNPPGLGCGQISSTTGGVRDQYVSGYTRRDGTYVRPYYRSSSRR